LQSHARRTKRFIVLGRQRKERSACERTNAGCVAVGGIWVDPLRHRGGSRTEDEQSRQSGLGFREHGFDSSN
jgi:hypothetical protein